MKIIHLSDIHFGAELPAMLASLKSCLSDLNPDLIVISGDFTQNGTESEFRTAHEFLKNLSAPTFCVPGNHDVPRLDLLNRFLNPYALYRKFITPDLHPVYQNDSVMIVGLNSSRRILPHWNWANGAVSDRQLQTLQTLFQNAGDRYRICVLHHPVHKAAHSPLKVKVFGAEKTLQILSHLKINMVLTGHVHYASIDKIDDTVFISASTAISHRTRMQSNGFNLIELSARSYKIMHYVFKDDSFKNNEIFEFGKTTH